MDKGSVFEVFLPLVDGEEELPKTTAIGIAKTSRKLKILLVDDELRLRQTGRQILEAMGHTVVTASDGKEAIYILDAKQDFDVALLDLTMPVMTGKEAYEVIKKRWPDLCVAI